MTAYQLGMVVGLLENGKPADSASEIIGFAKQAAAHQEHWGRPILRTFTQLMQVAGREKSATCQHLNFLNTTPWTQHTEEVLHTVIDTFRACEAEVKSAAALKDMANLGGAWMAPGVAGLGLAGKGLLYAGAGAGAGMGALWWMLNRHASQDDADNEAKQKQVEYYNRLAEELEDSMRRKHGY